ncbi:MAG: two-component sensor histidine kinase [Bacteroidia bacterium]|jgi:two-component sensor histidine kinase
MSSKNASQEYLSILSKLSADLISKNSLDEVVWSITENCISDLGFEDCVVYLLDSKKEFLVQKAAFGPKKWDNFKLNKPIKIPVGQGIVGSVAETGRHELIEDCSIDARYIADDANRLSEIAVPIIELGEVIGVIDSEHSEKNFYSTDHLSVLTAIANLASIRISQVQKTKSLKSHRDELAQQVATKKNELQNALVQVEITNRYLESMMAEKDEMLKEFHHRVKNKIQMMHSLINLQMNEVEQKEVIENLRTCMNRVRCMGLVYQMAEGLTIDIAMYLRNLNDELNSAHGLIAKSNLDVKVEGPEMSTEKAVVLGFLLVDLFASGLSRIDLVADPRSSVDLTINHDCRIHFESNWWDFEKLGNLTELFISQMGAEKIETETGLILVCR